MIRRCVAIEEAVRPYQVQVVSVNKKLEVSSSTVHSLLKVHLIPKVSKFNKQ